MVWGARERRASSPSSVEEEQKLPKWSMGILNDKETIQVPGSVLLLAQHRNEPLGLENAPARTSHSSLPTGLPPPAERPKKTNQDGTIILEPQPDDSANDPLNWPSWRRDTALLSLSFYSLVGGGQTPILAAGFTDVAADYSVNVARVSLTTGLYMMGMGVGGVFASPTAILWGKRPVYLASCIVFLLASVWCAASPSYMSLLVARIFQGMAVSPVECLPSATIAEIFFLHERAFRIGIYTLLLLGGKNLIPLVSAVIIGALGWRWVFWIVAIVVGCCFFLLLFLVPETFWDRTPVPKSRKPSRPNIFRRISSMVAGNGSQPAGRAAGDDSTAGDVAEAKGTREPGRARGGPRVGFADPPGTSPKDQQDAAGNLPDVTIDNASERGFSSALNTSTDQKSLAPGRGERPSMPIGSDEGPGAQGSQAAESSSSTNSSSSSEDQDGPEPRDADPEKNAIEPYNPPSDETQSGTVQYSHYTTRLRSQPTQSFSQSLRPYNGRLSQDNWFKVMARPFILYAYPSILWAAAMYACSVGWLIVISESIAIIYRHRDAYNFDALQTGLVYISPFIGGVLGTAVAGKVSDVVVQFMARHNGGLYEPEFRLVMVVPVLLSTVAGLMGFGWSAEVHDHWMVPTVMFGLVSFGCCLGSTTAITFALDSYRQYAGESLVTLNFSKNIFHGLVFSLFVTEWLEAAGSRSVYVWIGVIHLILCLATVPMYVYGKRARMWTVRKNFMEKF